MHCIPNATENDFESNSPNESRYEQALIVAGGVSHEHTQKQNPTRRDKVRTDD
jgi:hypothetical protein